MSTDPVAAYPHDRKPITLEGKAAGRAAGMLIARKKVAAEPVAHKLEIRAQILRDMSWAVGQGGPGIPAMREANVKMAADELDAASEIIRRLANIVPRTARDAVNEAALEKLVLALKMVRDGRTDEETDGQWCAGVAMSALASVEEMGLDV